MSDLDDLLREEQQREFNREAQREAEMSNWRDPEEYDPYQEERRRIFEEERRLELEEYYEEDRRLELEEYDADMAAPLPVPDFQTELYRMYRGEPEPDSVAARLIDLLASVADSDMESEAETALGRIIAAYEATRNHRSNVTRGWTYKRWDHTIHKLLREAGVNLHPDHSYAMEHDGHTQYCYEPYRVVEFEELAKLRKLGWKVEVHGNTAIHFPGWTVVVRLNPPPAKTP